MSNKIAADLHTHTVASDGELEPEALVDLAADAGLQILAVTDHDSADGVARAAARGKERGIEVIPGCELTIYVNTMELHLLAFFIDPNPDGAFQKLLRELQQHRAARITQIIAQLNQARIAISEADVRLFCPNASSMGRQHVAAALVLRNYARSLQDAHTRLLSQGKPGHVPKFKLTPEAAFAAVRESGGVSILAHPGRTQHDELITPLLKSGMDGVESHYRAHSEANRRYYAGLEVTSRTVLCLQSSVAKLNSGPYRGSFSGC